MGVRSKAHKREAENIEEIKPLLALCRSGKLFEVQEWIKAGKPVNLPQAGKGSHAKSPISIAIELGFHSLVLVLLRGGAAADGSMYRALQQRRSDLVELLVEHGYSPASVNMAEVFETWDPELMEYFIERGADVETDVPLAHALCNRVRTALRIFKKYRERFPSFSEQANIALRYHCTQRNMKWVSLMLWAGADPYVPGVYRYDEDADPDYAGATAIELAALYEFFEFFSLKQVKIDVKHPAVMKAARWACEREGIDLLKTLLDKGLKLNDQENGGSSTTQHLLEQMGWDLSIFSRYGFDNDKGIDTERTRGKIEALRLLAERGVRWVPNDRNDINSVRRALLKLRPQYTAELVLIMSQHRGCAKEDVAALVSTPAIQRHVSAYNAQITRMLAAWE
jgi:hypothetical protein